MTGWLLGGAGFVAGVIIFFAVFYLLGRLGAAFGWVYVSYGLGAAFIVAPAALMFLLWSGADGPI